MDISVQSLKYQAGVGGVEAPQSERYKGGYYEGNAFPISGCCRDCKHHAHLYHAMISVTVLSALTRFVAIIMSVLLDP